MPHKDPLTDTRHVCFSWSTYNYVDMYRGDLQESPINSGGGVYSNSTAWQSPCALIKEEIIMERWYKVNLCEIPQTCTDSIKVVIKKGIVNQMKRCHALSCDNQMINLKSLTSSYHKHGL